MDDKMLGKQKPDKEVYSIDAEGNRVKHSLSDRKKRDGSNFDAFRYMNLGYYLVIPLIIGLACGLALDKWWDTKPIFTLILLGVGLLSTFYNLYKITKT